MTKNLNDYPYTISENLQRFKNHWQIEGRAEQTFKEYERLLNGLIAIVPTPTLLDVETWLAAEKSPSVRRFKGRAIRSFGKWLTASGDVRLNWWKQVPLAKEVEKSQPTVTAEEYEALKNRDLPFMTRLIVELLWSTGMRRTELSRVKVSDVNLDEHQIRVQQSKSDTTRAVPVNDEAAELLKAHLVDHPGGLLIGRTSESIRKTLRRCNIASAHCWRRGWTTDSIANGIDSVLIQVAGGWSSLAMVKRYTRQHQGQVAIAKFHEMRTAKKQNVRNKNQ
jgi:integrase